MMGRRPYTLLKTGGILILVIVVTFALAQLTLGQDPETRGMSEEKRADYYRMKTQEVIDRTPKVKKEKVADRPAEPTEVPVTPVPLLTGIIEERQAPFPSSDVSVKNKWQMEIDGQLVIVYAGGQGADFDQNQGLLVVATQTLDGKKLGSKRYNTPEKVGPVQIVAADGMLLTVAAENGRTFVFDVATATFQ
jgi:hypothetical protein